MIWMFLVPMAQLLVFVWEQFMASQDSREWIIHAIIRVRRRIRSKQHVRVSSDCRSTFDILKVYLREEVFFCCVGTNAINFLHITNSNSRSKHSPFFLFRVTNITAFGNFTSAGAILIIFYPLWLLFRNESLLILTWSMLLRRNIPRCN